MKASDPSAYKVSPAAYRVGGLAGLEAQHWENGPGPEGRGSSVRLLLPLGPRGPSERWKMDPGVAGEESGAEGCVGECGSVGVRVCTGWRCSGQDALPPLSLRRPARLSASGAAKGSAAAGQFGTVIFDVKFDNADQPWFRG